MRRRSESGYALLLVLAMGASVAIMLYMELPRLVFESQRILEQDLIVKGEQYQRAIQLFVRKQRRYPGSLDELESTDNIRYLRRRYRDPMTGSDEWRVIHIDGAGNFLDSLLHDPPDEEQVGTTQNTFITEGPAFGSMEPLPGAEGAGAVTGAGVQGASDRPVVTADQFFGIPGGASYPQPEAQQPGQPFGGQYPQPGFPTGSQPGQYLVAQPQQVLQPGQQPQANSNVLIGGLLTGPQQTDPNAETAQQQGAPFAYPTMGIPGMPGAYGQLSGAQQQQPGSSGPQFTMPQQTPARIATTPSTAPNTSQASNAAVDLIRNILTTPRPGGLAGLQSGQAGSGQNGMQGGIAGVASNLEVEGIMVYNDRTKYNEWEFLYDYSADQTATATGRAGQGAEQGASQAASGTGPGGGAPSVGGNADGRGGNRAGGNNPGGGGQNRGGGAGAGRGGGNGGFGGFGGFGGGQGGQFPPVGVPPAPGGRGGR